jgi:thioredoxin-like negative regulator of GroEL
MTVQPVEPIPTAPVAPAAPAATTPTAPAPTEPAAAAPEAPPWGADFDAEKAWKLVQNLRSDKDKLATRPVLTDEQKTKLAEYDKVLESQKTAEQKAQEAAAAAEKRVESLTTRAVQAEVKALAATGFADPEDASAFLDLKKYATADGDVDTAAITTDLADLLARKPHLGKSPATPGMKPNPAQGSSALPPAGLDDQIAAATKAGNHALAISLKRQKYAPTT